MTSRLSRAIVAAVVLVTLVVGTPIVLVLLVGNPWPGRTRVELGDELAVVVGVLAVLGWLVWGRFLLALVAEVRTQLDERLRLAAASACDSRRLRFEPPPIRTGTGQLAQRLVAAILVLIPAGVRLAPSPVAAGGLAPAPRVAAAPVVALPDLPSQPTPIAGARSVTVSPGDTLIGIARAELADADRWREIFDANRDTVQPDGGRLTSPSLIRPGWTLVLPLDAPASFAVVDVLVPAGAVALAPAVVTAGAGDNLWELSRDRLVAAGLPHDEVAIADYVHAVIEGNSEVIEDPDVIFVGEEFELPPIGIAPASDGSPTAAAPAASESAGMPAPPAPVTADPPSEIVAGSGVTANAEAADRRVVDEEPSAAAASPTTSTPTTTTPTTTTPATTTTAGPGAGRETPGAVDHTAPSSSPAPIGLGEAALLSAGVVGRGGARRRGGLRASSPRARVPDPHPDAVDAERRLRSVDASERLLRVDIAIRAAAAWLVRGSSQIVVVRAGADGVVELTLTAPAELPPPWVGAREVWRLPGSTPIELLADAARTVGAPCVALAQLGVDVEGRDVLADLETMGVMAIDAPGCVADAVLRGLAATLASSEFAEVAHLVGAGIDERAFLGHRHAHATETVDGALELAATVIGATSAARQSTFVLRARHTSGEAWEPAVVFVSSDLSVGIDGDVVRSATRVGSGLALVAAGPLAPAPWTLRTDGARWTFEPLGIELVPVGLSEPEVDALHSMVVAADAPLVDDVPSEPVWADEQPETRPESWVLLVRMFGPVEIIDGSGQRAAFERSKALELVAWLTLHREQATRSGARTALWELDVRDATFANVVSEARRAMARLVDPPPGEEWLGRTLTEVLPLHRRVVADVDVIRARLDAARLQPPELAIETLRPAVELVRDAPFTGTGYLWPDAEGITSNLVLLATSAATELAGHFLSMGDIEGVFWATDRGLRVLPGHEELIALRMRAHARAGDLAGVRHEWETYERVLNADPWGDGEPADKLVLLRRELLAS